MTRTSAYVAALLLSLSSTSAHAGSNDPVVKVVADMASADLQFELCNQKYASSILSKKSGSPNWSDQEAEAQQCMKSAETKIDRTHTDFLKSNGQGPKAEIVRRWRVRMHDLVHRVRFMRNADEREIISEAVDALLNRAEAELKSL